PTRPPSDLVRRRDSRARGRPCRAPAPRARWSSSCRASRPRRAATFLRARSARARRRCACTASRDRWPRAPRRCPAGTRCRSPRRRARARGARRRTLRGSALPTRARPVPSAGRRRCRCRILRARARAAARRAAPFPSRKRRLCGCASAEYSTQGQARMKIIDKLGSGPAFSFEFFPPKGPEGMEQLFETVARLRTYDPAYVSVTYGAGGSTRRLTVELVQRIKREAGLETMAHLTCVGAHRDEIAGVLNELTRGGIENVIALRGDPPRGQTSFVTPEGGFSHASELIAFIREKYDFCIAAACYPEKHPEAPSFEADLQHTLEKVRAGADLLITQLFFDPRDYFRFVERARAIGITVPIVPGVMPITNVSQVKRFTAM